MASFNKVFLMGRLTRDPELRYTAEGTAVADMNLAVSQKFTSKSGEQKENVVFTKVTVWRKQAEACGEYLFKGSEIFVEGRLQLDTWETKDGQRRSRLSVIAQRVQFLGKPKGARTDSSAENRQETPGDIIDEGPKAVLQQDAAEEETPF